MNALVDVLLYAYCGSMINGIVKYLNTKDDMCTIQDFLDKNLNVTDINIFPYGNTEYKGYIIKLIFTLRNNLYLIINLKFQEKCELNNSEQLVIDDVDRIKIIVNRILSNDKKETDFFDVFIHLEKKHIPQNEKFNSTNLQLSYFFRYITIKSLNICEIRKDMIIFFLNRLQKKKTVC